MQKDKMKILVSSKALATFLSQIDFENDEVRNIMLEVPKNTKGKFHSVTLIMNTKLRRLNLCVTVRDFEGYTNQRGRGWENIKKLVSLVEEQPIVLEIGEKCTSVIFQY